MPRLAMLTGLTLAFAFCILAILATTATYSGTAKAEIAVVAEPAMSVASLDENFAALRKVSRNTIIAQKAQGTNENCVRACRLNQNECGKIYSGPNASNCVRLLNRCLRFCDCRFQKQGSLEECRRFMYNDYD
jgi:hypothetical protein